MPREKHSRLKQLWNQLFGTPEQFEFEHRFINTISFLAGIASLLTLTINVFLVDLPGILYWVISGLGIIFLGLYYLSRIRQRLQLVKWTITSILFPVFTFIFVMNNGSIGPLLYLYMVFLLLILFVWEGRPRILFIMLFLINIGILFFIENWKGEIIQPYESEKTRLLDVYLSYVIFLFLGGSILIAAKSNYIRERKKAIQSDKLKSAFLANMSHEIRTPMNAILGFSQLLEGEISKTEKAVFISTIKENSQTLMRLIEDIIDISKIEAGQVAIKNSEVEINQILTDLNATFSQVLDKVSNSKVKLVCDNNEETLIIHTDADRIRQILMNLIQNSIKFTERGEIRYGYAIEPPYVRFYVSDTGLGISKEYIGEVFDRFRKLESEEINMIHRGAGIGLSIAKNLTQLLGGDIWVESELGIGSTFHFTIAYEPVKEKSTRKNNLPAQALIQKPREQKRVLVVEDETANYLFLTSMLEELQLEIIHAENGKEAVELIRKDGGFDLILMDIRMPEMDGYEATRIIKEIEPNIPVIAQTALAMEGDRENCFEAGCDDYISKPILLNDFKELMNKHLIGPDGK